MKRYDSYKDSGIDCLGKIPKHWEMKKLNWCFDLIGSGTTPKADDEEYYNNGKFNWLLTGDLNDGEIWETSKKITPKALNDYSTLKEYPENSLVIAMYGATIGKLGLLKLPTTVNQACCVLAKPIHFHNLFAFYLLLAARKEIINMSYGGGQPNISQEIIKSFRVPTPPLTEQAAIASFLDRKTIEIDQLIVDKKRLIELYEEEKTAIINQAVTKSIDPNVKLKDSGIEWLGEIPEHWKVKRFDFLFSFSRGLAITKENLTKEGIPCVNYGEIHSKYGFEVNPNKDILMCVNKDYLISSKKSLLKRGDFVFADTSEDIKGSGNFTYLNSDIPTFAGYHTIIANPISKFIHRFVAYFFESLSFRNQIRCKVTGTKVYSITQSILKSSFVILPPFSEQEIITQYIEAECSCIDAKIEKTKKLIDLLTEYRTTLISEVVTGKIEVI